MNEKIDIKIDPKDYISQGIDYENLDERMVKGHSPEEHLIHQIAARKDQICEAWIAETGFKPSESVLCMQQQGTTWRFWVEKKHD